MGSVRHPTPEELRAVTGRAALPCGASDGLPVGHMLVGKHRDETTVYHAAHALEQSHDWTGVTA